jgi:GAF domain-containing protein
MNTTIEAVREQIRREERMTGLRSDGHVTDAAIRRRRTQIAIVAMVVLLGLILTTLANDLWIDFKRGSSIIDVDTARLGMLLFTAAFIAYALEKEMHLRRLSSLGHEAQQLNLQLADRILESAALADAERVVSASLDLDGVLHGALEQGAAMVVAASATVSLLAEDGELCEVASFASAGHAPRVADAIVMQVALAREPMLVSGPVPMELDPESGPDMRLTSVMCAPLEHDGRLLGVMTFGAPPSERFADDALEVMRRFAPRAAAAIARARRYEAAVSLVDSRGDPLAEEIRTVSATIRAAASELRSDLAPERRAALLDIVESGAGRLLAAVH